MTEIDPVALAQTLIRRPSVTPRDEGVLGVLEGALEPLGFRCERMPFSEPGTPQARTWPATLRPLAIRAASRRSDMRLLVQEPMNTQSIFVSWMGVPALRPM